MRRMVLAVLAALAFAGAAFAQNFPSRPITIIVPFSAGGPSDAMARILAERMKVTLGEAVLVENVTGAGGSIGVGRAAKSPRRRLHHLVRPSRHPCRQRRDLQARLRPRRRSRAGGAAAEQSHDHRQQERGAGEIAEGVSGLAEGAAGAAAAGTAGAGSGSHIAGLVFRDRHRHQAAICAVSRHGAGDERSRRRPDRPHRRPDLELDPAGARRQHPRLCHRRRQARRLRARYPDHGRGGPARLPHDAVVGHVGAQGHAEGHHRKTQRGGRWRR